MSSIPGGGDPMHLSDNAGKEKISESDLNSLRKIYDKYRARPGNTIPILLQMQEVFGYLPESAINWISDRLGVPRSTFYSVATFYSQFYLNPRGRNIVTICCGTACHVKGSDKMISAARKELGLDEEEETTADLKFTVETLNCVGVCGIAPVAIINKKVHGNSTSRKLLKEIKSLAGESEEVEE
jgi:NADH:ubiquinone oxidoreductase subunit E